MTKLKFMKHSFKRIRSPFEFKIKIKEISRITILESSKNYYKYIFRIYLNNKFIKKGEVWAYNMTEVKETIEKTLMRTLKKIQL